MDKKSKIDQCFSVLIPEVLMLMHDINYEQGQEMAEKVQVFRNYLRKKIEIKEKIDFEDEEFQDKLMDVVNAHGNYEEFMNLLHIIKEKFPQNSIRVIKRDGKATIEQWTTKHEEFIKNIEMIFSKSVKDDSEMKECIKVICEYIVNSKSSFHDLRETQA